VAERTLKVLPETIIYDVSLTLTLPAKMTVTSCINAIAHAVEALYANDANPVADLYSQQGIKSVLGALPVLAADAVEKDEQKILEARRDALFGAWMCGTCAAIVNMSLHHKLCHTLGTLLTSIPLLRQMMQQS
jgi:maleylacetate reductase